MWQIDRRLARLSDRPAARVRDDADDRTGAAERLVVKQHEPLADWLFVRKITRREGAVDDCDGGTRRAWIGQLLFGEPVRV